MTFYTFGFPFLTPLHFQFPFYENLLHFFSSPFMKPFTQSPRRLYSTKPSLFTQLETSFIYVTVFYTRFPNPSKHTLISRSPNLNMNISPSYISKRTLFLFCCNVVSIYRLLHIKSILSTIFSTFFDNFFYIFCKKSHNY